MILLNFGLWWSGSKLSYLRYLTFKTLRHFHPHSRIQLYTNTSFSKDGGIEDQDYVNPKNITKDYMAKLGDLGVEVIPTNQFSRHSPNHQSDMFRYWFMKNNGAFYLDTDQIILKSFKSLPLNKKFIYSSYEVKSPFALSGKFSPVGVLGASKDSKILDNIMKAIPRYYNPKNYNCIGPLMFLDMEKKIDMSEGFNAPSSYFYPAAICDQMNKVFDGSLKLGRDNMALHWFGGYRPSQKFNKEYTEEFAKTSPDSLSRYLREKKLI